MATEAIKPLFCRQHLSPTSMQPKKYSNLCEGLLWYWWQHYVGDYIILRVVDFGGRTIMLGTFQCEESFIKISNRSPTFHSCQQQKPSPASMWPNFYGSYDLRQVVWNHEQHLLEPDFLKKTQLINYSKIVGKVIFNNWILKRLIEDLFYLSEFLFGM